MANDLSKSEREAIATLLNKTLHFMEDTDIETAGYCYSEMLDMAGYGLSRDGRFENDHVIIERVTPETASKASIMAQTLAASLGDGFNPFYEITFPMKSVLSNSEIEIADDTGLAGMLRTNNEASPIDILYAQQYRISYNMEHEDDDGYDDPEYAFNALLIDLDSPASAIGIRDSAPIRNHQPISLSDFTFQIFPNVTEPQKKDLASVYAADLVAQVMASNDAEFIEGAVAWACDQGIDRIELLSRTSQFMPIIFQEMNAAKAMMSPQNATSDVTHIDHQEILNAYKVKEIRWNTNEDNRIDLVFDGDEKSAIFPISVLRSEDDEVKRLLNDFKQKTYSVNPKINARLLMYINNKIKGEGILIGDIGLREFVKNNPSLTDENKHNPPGIT